MKTVLRKAKKGAIVLTTAAMLSAVAITPAANAATTTTDGISKAFHDAKKDVKPVFPAQIQYVYDPKTKNYIQFNSSAELVAIAVKLLPLVVSNPIKGVALAATVAFSALKTKNVTYDITSSVYVPYGLYVTSRIMDNRNGLLGSTNVTFSDGAEVSATVNGSIGGEVEANAIFAKVKATTNLSIGTSTTIIQGTAATLNYTVPKGYELKVSQYVAGEQVLGTLTTEYYFGDKLLFKVVKKNVGGIFPTKVPAMFYTQELIKG